MLNVGVFFFVLILYYNMLNFEKPYHKISCLLVTANGRFEYFKRSFDCYLNQTYPNRELIIVNEGSKNYQNQLKDFVNGRKDVKCVFLDGKYTLGGLRNISVAVCSGEIFVQWDDDDFNMPERLATQYSHLINQKADVCYLTDQLHYYFPTQELYWENWEKFLSGSITEYSLIPGTIMAFKNKFLVRYPSSGNHASAGEDSVLSSKLCQIVNVVLLRDFGYLHVYSYHGQNVWDIEHHKNISRHRSFSFENMLKHRDRISKTLRHLKLSEEVSVMGRNGKAFLWRENDF